MPFGTLLAVSLALSLIVPFPLFRAAYIEMDRSHMNKHRRATIAVIRSHAEVTRSLLGTVDHTITDVHHSVTVSREAGLQNIESSSIKS